MNGNLTIQWGRLLACISVISFCVYGYVVKPGDSLSQIAFQHISKHVYGPTGSLQKLLALNPTIKRPNQLRTGTIILLPEATVPHFTQPPRAIADEKATPSLPNSPASKPARETPALEKTHSRFSLFTITPLLSYARWDGTDPRNGSAASLLTKMNLGIEATWTQVWSSRWQTLESIGVTRYEISPDSSTNLPIANSTQVAPRFGMGVAYLPYPNLTIGAKLLYAQELYYHGVSGFSGIVLDGVQVPEGQLWVKDRLLSYSPFDLSAEGRLLTLFPTGTVNYNTSFGKGYEAKLEIGQTFEDLRASVGMSYLWLSQNTSVLSLTEREIGFEVGLTWRLGK